MLNFKELLKPNKSKVIISIVLTVLYIAGFFYVYTGAICDRPSCQKFSAAQTIITPIVSAPLILYAPFDDVGNYLAYEKVYTFDNTGAYTLKPRFNNFISEIGVYTFDILGIIFMEAIGYLLSCLIYTAYESIKNKNQIKK